MARLLRKNKEIPTNIYKIKLSKMRYLVTFNTILLIGLYFVLFHLDKYIIDLLLTFYK